ncbi:MAG: urate hydroxylase PuuD [Phenylobacterium sp.]|uniref:urate hydroxylase PuuD n=1 Tax=Phenylobacterium sp. TaxID=1871053 RepID=UPI00301AD6F9
MFKFASGLLSNLRNTMILSSILALFVIGGYMHHAGGVDAIFVQAVLRFVHLVFGIMWIGLLYYFNFVQLRKMPEIPAELKPAVSKYIAPEALFWFRWAALFTWVAGVILAYNRGYLFDAFALGLTSHNPQHSFIGMGMWLATIMFFNVWVFIWPNQKIALGMVEADADAKAKAARTAMLVSRLNTFISIPMLATMGMNQTIFG